MDFKMYWTTEYAEFDQLMYMSKMKIMYDEISYPKTQNIIVPVTTLYLQALPIQFLSLQGGKTPTEEITF